MNDDDRCLGRGASRYGLLLALALLVSACDGSNTYSPPPPPAVDVAHPLRQDVTRYLRFSGSVEAVRTVNLIARVEGTLQSIDYKDGAQVKKDQRLFLIDPAPYEAQVAQVKASVDQATATLANAQSQYDRQVQLGTTNVASQSNIDTARAARDTAQAQVNAAKANLEIAQLNLGYTTVLAPFDGVVTAHQAEVGALVSHGTQLATIVQLNPINVTFNLSENDMLQIRHDLRERGLTAQGLGPIPVDVGTTIEKGYPHRGTLDYIAPQVDPRMGTLALRAVVQNGDVALLPGIFVRVRIPSDVVKDALLVPAAAIGTDQQGSYVIVVDDKKLAQQRHVTSSAGPEGFEVIDSGIKPEDWVIVGGLDRAVSGSAIAPKETTLTPPPADPAAAAPNR